MGNCASCCQETSFYRWIFPKKLNLPIKPVPEERPKPITPILEEDAELLNITGWDYLPKLNGSSHHTSSYSLMEEPSTLHLVVRRGQKFSLRLATSRRYSKDEDQVGVVLTVADSKNPSFGNGTQVGVGVSGGDSGSGWTCNVTEVQEKSLTIEICSSCSAIVGEWKIEVDVKSSKKTHSFPAPSTIFMLFNPWIADDPVYVKEDDRRKEYVEDDVGLIWRGTHNRQRPVAWQFGQYDDQVLRCVLHVLTSVCRVIPSNRADPIKVVRAISAGINSPDDNGVLVGNWSGEYEGGTKPTEWSGSIQILQQYYKTKAPVKFGQCWVFSGVVTSACRALGIPCRPITNFSSAHDTHNSLTIDYFFDEDGEEIERLNSDSIWNFHVWNECWLRRPDLGEEYNGWQVIDATPQEESDGEYRCGPASLVAIKKGEIHKSFDVPFVYAEVNADKLFWKYRGPNSPMKLLGKKTKGVGQKVSTKAVGRWTREDVTHLYKHEDDSREERSVMRDALTRCENVFARYYLNEDFADVEFDLKLIDDIVIGAPFSVLVEAHNKGTKEHCVKVVLRADAMLYTGTVKGNIKKQEFNVTMPPQTKKEMKLEISFADYYKKLVDQCALKLACMASLKDTDYEYYAEDDFRIRKPDIIIEPESEFRCGEVTKCVARFKNPLPMILKTPRFYVLPSKGETSYIRLKTSVDIEEEAHCEFDVQPRTSGDMTISVMFMSRELEDVNGHLQCDVKAATGTDEEETVPLS